MSSKTKTRAGYGQKLLSLFWVGLQLVGSYLLVLLLVTLVVWLVAPGNPDASLSLFDETGLRPDAAEAITARLGDNIFLVDFLTSLLWLPLLVILLVRHFGKNQPGKNWWGHLDLSRPSWRDVGVGIILALALSQLVYVIMAALDWLGLGDLGRLQLVLEEMPTGGLNLIWFMLSVAILAPLIEELVFRRWLYKSLADIAPLWVAVGLGALIFGAAHYESLQVVLGATVFGAGFILAYRWSNNLWTAIIMHAVNNFLVLSLFHLGYGWLN